MSVAEAQLSIINSLEDDTAKKAYLEDLLNRYDSYTNKEKPKYSLIKFSDDSFIDFMMYEGKLIYSVLTNKESFLAAHIFLEKSWW